MLPLKDSNRFFLFFSSVSLLDQIDCEIIMTSGIPRTLVGARSPGGNLDSPPHPLPHAAAAALVVAPTSEWKQFQAQHGGAILPGVGSVQYHADHGSHSSTAASENSGICMFAPGSLCLDLP